MDSEALANDLAGLMDGMPKGLYLLLCTAIEQLGGEMRLHGPTFAARAGQQPPPMELQVAGDEIILKPATASA
jgi:hypothetical protein